MGTINKPAKGEYVAPRGRFIHLKSTSSILHTSGKGHIEGVDEGEEHGWGQE